MSSHRTVDQPSRVPEQVGAEALEPQGADRRAASRGRTALSSGIRFAFGEVRHRRLRPVGHAFRYRAWFVRVPIDALETRSGGMLFGINRRALLALNASDHGDGRPVREWLDDLLAQGGIQADGEVWLHAFASVLGYEFKPVSFWFCHRADGALAAVVAEVHNTFGERHVYLLSGEHGESLKAGAELRASKSFHVSPFCEVRGGYRFRFVNRPDRALARIDYDDDEGELLRTSLSGRFEPAGLGAQLRALLGFPLFSLGVIARIHWHALRLWLARVPFHRKPAAPAQIVTKGSP